VPLGTEPAAVEAYRALLDPELEEARAYVGI